MRRALLAGAALLALVVGATAQAGVLQEPITPNGQVDFNDPPEYGPGSTVIFDNSGGGGVAHNVTADDDGPDGKPLFRSGNVSPGDFAEVRGVPFLDAGQYPFHCSIHPNMQATLQIGGEGPGTVPRPEISLKVKSKKLEEVVESGKLKVKVTAGEPTDADGITLSAKKGAKGITKKAKLNVDAGDSKTAKLKLKKSAGEKLAELDKAKVKVTGEVDFGSPAKAGKKLK